MTDMRLRRSVWTACTALLVMSVGMLSDGRAQDTESADVNRKEVTAEFSYLRLGAMPALYQIAGMTFFAHSSATSNPAIVDQGTPAERGYAFPDSGLTVVLPREATRVAIRLCLSDSEVTVEALSSAGTSISQQTAQSLNTCGDLAIQGSRISIVRFTGSSGQASIVRLTAVSGHPPAVFAGADRSVAAGSLVVLAGMAWDPDGSIASYAWTQITEETTDDMTEAPTVLLRGAASPRAVFSAPDVSEDVILTFRLTVTDEDGDTARSHVRVTVIGWGGVFTSVSAGKTHTCAVRDTGAVECWGDNEHDQSVPPTGTFTSVSVAGHSCAIRDTGAAECWGSDEYGQASPPAGVFTELSTRRAHTCGLRDTGAVECWGWNRHGQASPPEGMFISVAAGGEHSCAVRKNTGMVQCWGNSGYNMTTAPEGEFVSVTAGYWHTCGIKKDTGAVACWGWDDSGRITPPDGAFIVLSAGEDHTCGLRDTGAVACWGSDDQGQSTHGQIDAVSVGAGGDHACAVREDTGAVECWGRDVEGQSMPPMGTFESVGVGRGYACGVRPTGGVECWGGDDHGQSSPPEGVFVSLTAGAAHTCGLRDTGAVACWGLNDFGQASPPAGAFVSVDAGRFHTCGVRASDGTVACWGRYSYGVDEGDW